MLVPCCSCIVLSGHMSDCSLCFSEGFHNPGEESQHSQPYQIHGGAIATASHLCKDLPRNMFRQLTICLILGLCDLECRAVGNCRPCRQPIPIRYQLVRSLIPHPSSRTCQRRSQQTQKDQSKNLSETARWYYEELRPDGAEPAK